MSVFPPSPGRPHRSAILRSFLLVLLLFLGIAPTRAAETPATPTASEIETLIRTIEDDRTRADLLARLRALATASAPKDKRAPEDAGILATLSTGIQTASRDFVATIDLMAEAPRALARARVALAEEAVREAWLRGLATLIGVCVAGYFGFRLTRIALARPRRIVEARTTMTVATRAALAIGRLVLDLVPVAIAAAIGYGIVVLAAPIDVVRLLALLLITSAAAVGVATAVARLLTEPDVPTLRVVPMSDDTANYLFVWARRLAAVAGYGYFIAEAAVLLGVPKGAHELLIRLIGLALVAMVAILILQNRQAVAAWIRGDIDRGGGISGVRVRLADLWHVLALVYLGAIYAIWALHLRGGFGYAATASLATVAILVATRFATRLAIRFVDRLFHIAPDLAARYPDLEARASLYRAILDVALRVFIYVLATFFLLEAWGLRSIELLGSALGQRVVGAVFSLVLVAVIAIVVWEAASALIDQLIERGRVGTRGRTVLPLLRVTIKVVLVVMVGLIALSTLGINITPLLAGAGVVGLAIGFGAQALVKDVITGFFILMEDQIAIGDIVTVASRSGVVESMSIRAVRLRDLAGNVHMIPFGEITTVENRSKEFAYAVLDVRVAYAEDVDRVIAELHVIGGALREDARFASMILEPIEVLGVEALTETAVVIRARIKTLPGRQFAVGREFNRLLKRRFDELGIEHVSPQQRLQIVTDSPPARGRRDDSADGRSRD